MKKFLRVALVVAVLASLASVAMADPTGTIPQPQVSELISWRVALTAILSLLSL